MRWLRAVIASGFLVGCGDDSQRIRTIFFGGETGEHNLPWEEFEVTFVFGLIAKGWVEIPITFHLDIEFSTAQTQQIKRAAEIWNHAIDPNEETILIADERIVRNHVNLLQSLGDEINGIYLHADWSQTKKLKGTLGTAKWLFDQSSTIPKLLGADINLNQENFDFGDTHKLESDGLMGVVDLTSLMLHEMGHALGLSHTCCGEKSVMRTHLFTGLGMTHRVLTPEDIARVRYAFGKESALPEHIEDEGKWNEHEAVDSITDSGRERGFPAAHQEGT